MWVALVPSGMDWLDAEIGGVPASGVVAALGAAGSGKTSLALGYTIAQLRRGGRVCYLTSETPEAVLETCRGMLERDLHPWIAQGALTVLSFAPFFVSKVRSLNSVDPPLAELKELFDERGIEHVVFDTLDPMLTWIDAASAKAGVRNILGQIQTWKRSVLCTLGGGTPAAAELARTASGSLELGEGKLVVRHAGWCNVYDVEAAVQFVQGRGSVVRPNAGRTPARPSMGSDRSLIAASPLLPDSERRPDLPAAKQPWMSLIGDANKLLGVHAVKLASKEVFDPPPPGPALPPAQDQDATARLANPPGPSAPSYPLHSNPAQSHVPPPMQPRHQGSYPQPHAYPTGPQPLMPDPRMNAPAQMPGTQTHGSMQGQPMQGSPQGQPPAHGPRYGSMQGASSPGAPMMQGTPMQGTPMVQPQQAPWGAPPQQAFASPRRPPADPSMAVTTGYSRPPEARRPDPSMAVTTGYSRPPEARRPDPSMAATTGYPRPPSPSDQDITAKSAGAQSDEAPNSGATIVSPPLSEEAAVSSEKPTHIFLGVQQVPLTPGPPRPGPGNRRG